MASLNKAIIIGNAGRDPEVRFTPGGQSVANFTVATNERWTDKSSGQLQERTEWHRIVVWGKLAETCGQYLKKGRSVYVEGRLQTREWTNKEGQKQYTTEIVASQVLFLGSKGEGAPAVRTGPDEYSSPSDFEPTEPRGPGLASVPAPAPGAPSSGGEGRGGPGEEDIPF